MKKLFLLFALFAAVNFAQTITGNPPQLPRIPQDPTGARGSVLLNYDPISGTYSSGGSGSMSVLLDSLYTADTVSIMYFGHRFTDGFFTLYDSLGKATTDTFYVERYDTLAPQASKLWTSVQITFVDVSTVQYTTSVTGRYTYAGANVITPGVGLTKTYYINELRPGTYRIWCNLVDVYNGKKKYLKWTGKNR